MEDEITNSIKVWLSIFASLTYSYFISTRIPKGKLRLMSLLPIIALFTVLPLKVSSSNPTGLFIAWFANFKLLLFAFGQGPLSSARLVSLPQFICVASLPIIPSSQITKNNPKLSLVKVFILALLIQINDYNQHIHPTLLLFIYCFYMYLFFEIIYAVSAIFARYLLGQEIEPQFNEPYLSTSLRDFWGKRWNLVVSTLLRLTIYEPVRRTLTSLIGKESATNCAKFSSFLVSGLMHELVFFYWTRQWPTWSTTLFFALHGACLLVEAKVKKHWPERWRLHPVVSCPMTLGFLILTSVLFFPKGFIGNAMREWGLVFQFVKGLGQRMNV